MPLHRPAAALLAAVAVFWSPAATAGPPPRPEVADIDGFVREAMAVVEAVPGLAIAVVEGEEIVLAAGYGVADVRTGAPVDAETAFYIASSTKSFTALAIAAMAARGEVELDAPLAGWVGDADLPPEMARAASLADLLSHRSGLDNAPMAFRAAMSGEHTPGLMRSLVARTTWNLEAPHGTFDYTNAGYNLATTLLESRFGMDWRTLVHAEVLAPAGMSRTTAWISRARANGAVAAGHLGHLPGAPLASPLQKVDATMQSAGGLVSTASDMARWLEIQLNDGVIDGRRVFPPGLVASTHRPLALQDRSFGAYHRDGYGLGWQTGRYRDDLLVHHFGNFAGSRAHVSFMPARRLGVVVMVNEDVVGGELADVVANFVYDRFAGRADLKDVYKAELKALTTRRDQRREAVAKGVAVRAARPWMLSRPFRSYVGTYANPAMGTVEVAQRDGGLTVRAGVMSARAEPGDEAETIRVELAPLRGQTIVFDGPDSLIFEGERFVRTPDQGAATITPPSAPALPNG